MKKPDWNDDKFRSDDKLLKMNFIAAQDEYIDQLESENKSLKENLQAIAGSTQDSEEPLTKCIHGIAIKHLKK